MVEKNRRMSLRNVFKRPQTPSDHSSIPSGPPSPVEKRHEYFASSPGNSENSSPRMRPRTLQKANRTSVFESRRSLHSLDEDETVVLTRTDSKSSSMNEDGFLPAKRVMDESIIHHGEIQSVGSTVFRKRTQYFVLTESYLVRFKNLSKAIEAFPVLGSSAFRPSVPRKSSSSIGSLSDLQMTSSHSETQTIALDQIVGVYKVDDARQSFVTEISWLDERSSRSGSIQLQFSDPQESSSWTCAIQQAVAIVVKDAHHHQPQTADLSYITRALELQQDYDPLHFRAFRIVQLSALKPVSRSSTDDFTKSSTSISFLAIGTNKIHFIHPPRTSKRSSSTSLGDDGLFSLGIATLLSLKLLSPDGILELRFKHPLNPVYIISIASIHADHIALWIRFASEYIRPEWTIQPFIFDVPAELEDKMDPPNFPPEDNNSFERTLRAYCAAFEVEITRITYTVNYEGEDTPCFQLLSPMNVASYSNLELLAITRALRYNEAFTSISFADVDLRPLRDFFESAEADIDCQSTRSGASVQIPGHSTLSLLSREIRALALKSRRLRRMDFTNTLSPPNHSGDSQESGIPLALAPLSKKALTNLDWIILNGIQLAESDLDHLVDAASERLCHFRALEVGDCGLSVHDVDVLLSTLAVHEHTLEVINVSAAQGRFSPEILQRAIGSFTHIRKLNLARCQKTAGPEPLIASEILLSWRLESLILSQASLNEQMIHAIAEYLRSSKSDTLRELHLNQCGLTGRDLATLLQAMTHDRGIARNMHVNASENRLGVDSSTLAKCIAENYGPQSLSLRMIDFDKEHHFRELIDAVSSNTTLRSLDLSRASLPYDASEETCESLKIMLATNKTLEELDISGEHAHLDAARFGIGLNIALLGLTHNNVLKSLRIEHQSLGLQGASTLAGVLESNQSLLEVHCEYNEINLQSFTVLVNALRKNKTLLYMPELSADKAKSIEKVREEFEKVERSDEKGKFPPKHNAIRKGLNALSHTIPRQTFAHHRKSSSISSTISFTEQDIIATMTALEEKWQAQAQRMQQYLIRNYNIAAGIPQSDTDDFAPDHIDLGGIENTSNSRPATADSLGRILARVKLDRTPTVEKPGLLDSWDGSEIHSTPHSSKKINPMFHLPEE